MSTQTFLDTAGGAAAAAPLPPDLALGPVHLVVSDLARSVEWYQRALGLNAQAPANASTAELGDGAQTLLVLHEDAQARPSSRQAGLYHFALLYPTREDLARAVSRLVATRTPIQGASD